MNYIKHLNAVFQKFAVDSRLNPTHISLYMALFQFWNINRFPKTFFLNREEVMQLSKIGSKVTYHRCLKQLDDWKYIQYMPSHNPFKGSEIRMLNFCTTSETSTEPTIDKSAEQVPGQAVVPYTNNTKPITNKSKRKLPQNENEVLDFFKKKEWPSLEAKKFFNHYQSISWKLGGKIRITDWESTAENWMLKAEEIRAVSVPTKNGELNTPVNEDFLKTKKEKNYNEPL